MEKIVRVLGWAGFACGAITAVFATMPGRWGLIAMFIMLPGFLLSSAYVLLSTRYRIESKFFNPGYAGMILSSVPLMLIIYFMLTK
ncbi:MAG TPA: hypothetical protein VFU15_16355 [Bacteroidia bacterium]|nr:hypothetical protein [Bacteroidia bacterium]